MAVFMINICKFNGCGIIFQTLGDLIQHIEDNHIDYDSSLVFEQKEKQQPTCLPLSYVLRFYAESDSHKQSPHPHAHAHTPTAIVPVTVPSSSSSSSSSFSSFHSSSYHSPPTPLSNENEVVFKEEDLVSDVDDSNDSWTTHEEFSSDFILRYGSKTLNQSTINLNVINQEKPFACPVPGCKKRYKNVNGIKYHSKNGHKNEGRIKKAYKCQCGKSYKTFPGLKNHTAVTQHGGATMTQLPAQPSGEMLQLPVKALTLKSIASLGLPLKTLIIRQDSQSSYCASPLYSPSSSSSTSSSSPLSPSSL